MKIVNTPPDTEYTHDNFSYFRNIHIESFWKQVLRFVHKDVGA